MQNSNCTWICPKCDFFNFSDSFFNEQFNLESENRFDLLAKGHGTKSTESLTSKNSWQWPGIRYRIFSLWARDTVPYP